MEPSTCIRRIVTHPRISRNNLCLIPFYPTTCQSQNISPCLCETELFNSALTNAKCVSTCKFYLRVGLVEMW